MKCPNCADATKTSGKWCRDSFAFACLVYSGFGPCIAGPHTHWKCWRCGYRWQSAS